MGIFPVVFMIFYLLFLMMILGGLEAFIVVSYIFSSRSLYAIAKRRGFEKPWLAWVPVGSSWLLGAISDQYRYVVHGQTRNRRKLLMFLSGGLMAIAALVLTVCTFWCIGMVIGTAAGNEDAVIAVGVIGYLLIWLMLYGMIAAAYVVMVFEYMAYFDLYRSCDPGKSLMYLLIGIFTYYPTPFFLYSCRNKDLGMIPRQEQPSSESATEQKEDI